MWEKISLYDKKWNLIHFCQYTDKKRYNFVNPEDVLKRQFHGDFAAFMVKVVLSYDWLIIIHEKRLTHQDEDVKWIAEGRANCNYNIASNATQSNS